jgi:hypothetical protein
MLLDSTPLLKKERNTRLSALSKDVCDPLSLHRSRIAAGLTADDYPMNSLKRQLVE